MEDVYAISEGAEMLLFGHFFCFYIDQQGH